MTTTDTGRRWFAAVAEFDSAAAIYQAAQKTSAAGYRAIDAHTPFPIHGLDQALRQGPSHIGWVCALFGVIGITGAQVMMYWMNKVDYEYWVSGKPPYAWPATIPITFECMVLLAAFAALFGMLGFNKLPRFNNPLFQHSTIHRATDDRFFLSIAATDPKFDSMQTPEFLRSLGGAHVELVED